MDVEKALKVAGGWGKYQKLLYILIFIAGIPNALLSLHFVLSHYEPDFHCRIIDEVTNNTLKPCSDMYERLIDQSIPMEIDEEGEIRRSQCKIYKHNSTDYNFEGNASSISNISDCNNGYTYKQTENQETALTEFHMVCADGWKAPFALTIYQTGMLFGAILGSLADRFGRRPVFLLSSLFQIVAMIFAALTWNYISYIISMFIAGFVSLINYVIAFIVAAELISADWRNFMTIGSFYSFTIGYCMVPGLGFLLQDWRWYLWAATVISLICYLPTFWLFPESARWLAAKGYEIRAKKELEKIAKMNGNRINFEEMKQTSEAGSVVESVKPTSILVSFRVLYKSGLGARCLVGMFGWFVASLVYYSISYYSTSFSKDRYLNLLYAGLAEFPSYIAAYYVVNFIGRPRSVLLWMGISGITSIALPLVDKDMTWVRTALSILGKAGVTAGYYVIFLIASEVVPTLQRGSSLSICSICGRAGAVVAPFLMYSEKLNKLIPNFIMGILALLFAILTIMYVPETNGLPMPDTIDEAKSNRRFYGWNIFRNPKTTNFSRNVNLTNKVSEF